MRKQGRTCTEIFAVYGYLLMQACLQALPISVSLSFAMLQRRTVIWVQPNVMPDRSGSDLDQVLV